MDAETTAELEQRIEQTVRNSVQGDLIYLTLPTYLEDISSTRIREISTVTGIFPI